MKLLREAYHAMCGFAGGELDLSNVPPGLVTLTGPNWNGKTTLLELPLAAWYREWASRTTNDISKWADARDSWVECDVEINDVVYRARVNIDGQTRKAQAVLSKRRPDGTWQLLTDGKVSTFDNAIAQLIPPKDALLCSQFAAQNRAGSLTGAARSKRKDLFIQFLWLEHIIAMSETAKQCHAIAETTAMVLRSRIDALEKESTEELEGLLAAQLKDALDELAQLEARSQELSEQIAAADAERVELAEAVERYATAAAEHTRLAGAVAVAEKELADLPSAVGKLVQQAGADADASNKRREKGLASIEAKIAALNALVADGDAIRAASNETSSLKLEVDRIRSRQTQIPTEKKQLEDQLRDLRAASLMAQVPCGGAGDFAACQFLKDARAAQGRLDGRTEADLRAGLQTLADETKSCTDRLKAAQARLQSLKPMADKLAELRVATDRMEEYEIQRDELLDNEEERLREVQARFEEAVAALDAKEVELNERLAADKAEIERVVGVMAATEGAKSRVAVLEAQLAEARNEFTEIERRRSLVAVTKGDRERALSDLAARRVKAEALRPRLRQVEDDLRVQSLLMRAFHRDGLPTLEIAAAAPAISQLTTDLLEHSGFGSRFRVDVTTLVPTADGKEWKEDFAVRVWDNDRGKEILEIGDLSGGERILVEEALRAALTIYMASRHTHRVRTCWRDETTGPLDAENRPRYIAMLRRLRQLGQYDHVLYVSHADDAIDAADTIVDVRNGAAKIRRVA